MIKYLILKLLIISVFIFTLFYMCNLKKMLLIQLSLRKQKIRQYSWIYLFILWNISCSCFLTSSWSISSGTFLVELHTANADEWENMSGALLTRKASRIVALAVWLRSINIPSLFISRTTAFPNPVRPPPVKFIWILYKMPQ